MRIAVVGTGGIGGPYGASLAKAGADVTFVARGAHLAAIRENGLRVEGDRGETHIRPARATDDIAGIGPVDFVLFCVKLWDVESVGGQLRALVGPETAVVPLQNGVDAAERLIPILGQEAVMGGIAFVTGTIVAPGIIRQTGDYQSMTFGERDGRFSERGPSEKHRRQKNGCRRFHGTRRRVRRNESCTRLSACRRCFVTDSFRRFDSANKRFRRNSRFTAGEFKRGLRMPELLFCIRPDAQPIEMDRTKQEEAVLECLSGSRSFQSGFRDYLHA